MKKHRSGRRGGGSATVSIHVRDLAQLFNSLDPSPFWDRDLDREAAEFIEELWRPAEALGYEWVPFLRKRRLYERLAGIRVAVRSEPVSIAEKHVRPGA